MKIAIIGAGPTGLTIAHQLTKQNIEVDIYDTSKDVGGFAKSIKLWDQNIEIGPHFLNISNSPAVQEMVLRALNGNYKNYQRKTFIITINKMFSYPPVVGDIIKNLNIAQLFKAGGSLIKQTTSKKIENGTAESFVKPILGSYLYKYFFENFSRKLWGLNTAQISDVFAKSLLGFTEGFSPFKILYRKIKQSFKPEVKYTEHIYPNNGFSSLWNALKLQIEAQGGNFYLSAGISELTCEDYPDKITRMVLNDGTVKEYDIFISTIPVLPLTAYLKNSQGNAIKPGGVINYRNDILLYLKVEVTSAVAGQCFYVYSEDIKITRVTNFNEFDADNKRPFNIILLEFWCGNNDTIWNADKDELLATAINELNKTNIFTGLKVLDMTVKKVENAFQVPDMGLVESKDKLFEQLSVYSNLYVTGRTASVNFNYGMENAMADGLLLADEIIAKRKEFKKRDVLVTPVAE